MLTDEQRAKIWARVLEAARDTGIEEFVADLELLYSDYLAQREPWV